MAVQYSEETKKSVVEFVLAFNEVNGDGGVDAAVKKFRINPVSISHWVKQFGNDIGPTEVVKEEITCTNKLSAEITETDKLIHQSDQGTMKFDITKSGYTLEKERLVFSVSSKKAPFKEHSFSETYLEEFKEEQEFDDLQDDDAGWPNVAEFCLKVAIPDTLEIGMVFTGIPVDNDYKVPYSAGYFEHHESNTYCRFEIVNIDGDTIIVDFKASTHSPIDEGSPAYHARLAMPRVEPIEIWHI